MAGTSGKDVEAVYRMLYPKPKPLLQYCRELVRHGELIYYSPNTNSTKPRYFFLFDTALLLTKRTGKKRYWLKIYVHLRHGVTLVDNGPTDTQFRLMVTVKGRSRPIIMYGKNQQHKDLWVRDLKQVLWAANGRKGPDPSLTDSTTSPVGSRRGGQQQQPQQAAVRSGKEAKPQRDGFDASSARNQRYGDDDDADDDDFDNPSDDSGDDDEDEAEVEFMNVKDKSGPPGATIAHRQEEVDRLTHGLDSLVFDPFSDFIPPTSSAAAPSHASSAAYPASTLAYFPPPLASSDVPYAPVPTPFGPTGVPPQQAAFTPFGPVPPLAHPGAPVFGNPFAPAGAPVMMPPTQQAQLLYQQQLHLQQQMQQLAAIQQHYQSSSLASPSAPPSYPSTAPEDPFVALTYRG